MSSLPLILQILLAAPILFGLVLVVTAPEMIGGWLSWKRDEVERERAQQAELERKLAIAEAAIVARNRGETFVPPADYDR